MKKTLPSWFQKTFGSERGISLIVPALIIFVLVTALGGALTMQFETLTRELTKLRTRTQALQMMQELATLAHKANDRWVQAQPGPCPAGTTQYPTLRPYCWPNPMATNICLHTLLVGQSICFPAGLDMVRMYMPPPTMKDWLVAARDLASKTLLTALGNLTGMANAQSAAPWLPVTLIAGGPSGNLNNKCFNAATLPVPPPTIDAKNDVCKSCGGAAPPFAKNVDDCLTLQVCGSTDGICGPNQGYIQRIAVIPR